jgi:endoglucanase
VVGAAAPRFVAGPDPPPRRAADQENFLEGRNYSKTDTYVLDFGEFSRRGTYRVSVEGVGCSYPFVIGPKSWEEALRVSMLGFLQQRSGIELDEKLMGYSRPRDMHPGDGAKIFASKFSPYYGGQGQDDTFKQLMKDEHRTDTLLPGAWGGYHDAADWDRNSAHLLVTYELLELYDLFPTYYAGLKLKLPANEARNGIPDIIDEALWNLDLFGRLQEEDGGVRGGIESTCHPRPGERSWQESLMMSAFAPDPRSSSWFAACAAKTACVMQSTKPALASTYRAAAIKAWEWTEREIARVDSAKLKHDADPEYAFASVELYWLTSEKRFHDVYAELTVLKKQNPGWADLGNQRDTTFAYARLPDELADASLKKAEQTAKPDDG